MKKYEYLSHTADIKFLAQGKTLKEVFKNSALAVINAMTDEEIKKKKVKKIKVEGKDLESLMYNFIEEIIYLLDAEQYVINSANNIVIKKNKEGYELRAVFKGDNSEKYQFKEHIKAATYNDMIIKKTTKGWKAQAVLDV